MKDCCKKWTENYTDGWLWEHFPLLTFREKINYCPECGSKLIPKGLYPKVKLPEEIGTEYTGEEWVIKFNQLIRYLKEK